MPPARWRKAFVGATNEQGGYDATRYLIGLGHVRIGFITGNMAMGCAIDRLAGYRRALDEAGLACDDELIREGDFHQPRGYEARPSCWRSTALRRPSSRRTMSPRLA